VSSTDESRRRVAESLQRSVGALSTAAMSRMEAELPWFRELSADSRSWVGVIVQSGLQGFIEWYAHDGDKVISPPSASGPAEADVFSQAPRALAGVITLQQTVNLVRLSIDAVEGTVDQFLDPADVPGVHDAIVRFSRELAFATADVYARAAEVRGAWDARLEALVVDAVLRADADETVLSQASALAWQDRGKVCVVLGSLPAEGTEKDIFSVVRRGARLAGMDALCASRGDRLVVVLGGVTDPVAAAETVIEGFADAPVVAGPLADDLSHAYQSARSALSGQRAALGWPGAPRPVSSEDLLPERALNGDGHARRLLVEEVYAPLAEAKGTLIETIAAYFEHGSAIEGTARALFVHPNTVRYRLRQAADVTGLTPGNPRDAFVYQIALGLGRLAQRPARL
jgi:hypothetical protein